MAFRPYTRPRLSDEELLERSARWHTELESRRTVRSFSTDPVPAKVITRLCRAASTAPSGAHRQPWHFVIVGDAEVKRQIRHAAEAEEERNYDTRFPDEWKEALAVFGTDASKPYLEDAPWLIAVFAQDRTEAGKNYYVSESVGIACGVLVAGIHQVGLVSVTHTPSPMKFLKDILGRPKGERAYLLLAVGHPADDVEVPDLERKPDADIMTIL